MLRIGVAIFVFATASAQPLLAASREEIAVDSLKLAPADHPQVQPAVASDGEIFLAIWANYYGANYELYGGRFNRAGDLLDPVPIEIARQNGLGAKVAWSGRWFLVLHHSTLTKISREGKVIARQPLNTGGTLSPRSLTCNATRCLIVWGDRTGLHGSYTDPEGNLIQEIRIANHRGETQDVDSASSGTDFLVAWSRFDPESPSERYAVSAAVADANGEVSAARLLAVSNDALNRVSVASNGAGYLVAWVVPRPTRLDAVSLLPDGSPRGSATTLLNEPLLDASLLDEGGDYHVVFSSPDLILKSFRVRDGGSNETTPVAVTSTYSARGFHATRAGTTPVVVWTGKSAATVSDVYATRLTGTGEAEAPPLLISRSARPQRTPAISRAREQLLVVWQEDIDGWPQIVARRIGSEDTPRPIAPAAVIQSYPAVASSGAQSLVIWMEREHLALTATLVAQRVSINGSPVGSPTVLSRHACWQYGSFVATDDRDFLVNWADCEDGRRGAAAIIDSDGGPPIPVTLPARDFVAPGNAAWGGGAYLVVWREVRSAPCRSGGAPCPVLTSVHGARVTAAGDVLDSERLQISEQLGYSGPLSPRVVWDGTAFRVVWGLLASARVDADGTVHLPQTFARPAGTVEDLSLAWDGTAYVAAWTSGDDTWPASVDIEMVRVTPEQLDAGVAPAAFAVAASADHESRPSIIAIGPGAVAVAYHRVVHEREYGSAHRVFVRVLTFDPRSRAIRR